MPDESVSQALGLPGHTVLYRNMTKQEAIDEVRKILDRWESQGYKCHNDVPECQEKERYRELMTALGLKVAF